MAENNSKTFIIGIVVFVLLVIGGFAFFAKKDVTVDQTAMEATAPVDGVPAAEVTPAPAPVPEQTGAGEPAPEAAPAPAAEAAPAEAPATEAAPAAGEAAPAEQAPAAE